MTGLFYAHSGLRYLVLLAGIIAVIYYLIGLATRRPAARGDRVMMALFVGLLDLQIVLGIVLVATGIYYGALVGHIVMMLLAAGVAHGASVAARRAPVDRTAHGIRLAGVLGALLLAVGGILAIGRAVFGSGAPSVIS